MSASPPATDAAATRPWITMLQIPYVPEMAAFVRAVVASVLGEAHPQAGDARVVASELVTNALVHAKGRKGDVIDIILEVTRESARIEVHDDGPGAPVRRELGEGGFGLAIVEELASKWGHEPTASGAVWWAELA